MPVEKRVLMKNVPWWCKFHDVTTLSVAYTSKTLFHVKCEKLKICKISWYTNNHKQNTSTELSNEGRYTGTTELLFKAKLAIIETVWICLLWTDFFKHFPFLFFNFYVVFFFCFKKHFIFLKCMPHASYLSFIHLHKFIYIHTYTIHNRRHAQLTSTAAQLLYESKKKTKTLTKISRWSTKQNHLKPDPDNAQSFAIFFCC